MSRIASRKVAHRSAATLAGALLLAAPAFAKHDLAPTVSIDPAADSVTVSGLHHAFKPVLNLIRTDWWLYGTIQSGVPGDPVLMIAIDLPGWAALDSATDGSGAKLGVAIIARGPSTMLRGENAERVAVTLPRALAEKAEATGLTITVAGTMRSFPFVVPGGEIRAFLTGYDAAIAAAKAAPLPAPPAPTGPAALEAAPAAPSTPAPVPTPVASAPSPDAAAPPSTPPAAILPAAASAAQPTAHAAPPSSEPADAAVEFPVKALGIVIEPTSFGAMIASVASASPLAKLGVAEGDFIAGVDGTSIKGLTGAQMAARIGAPKVKILNCIADGDVTIR